MATTTLARPVRAHSRGASRAVQSLDDRFLETTGDYRLFGVVRMAKQFPNMEYLGNIGQWIGIRSVDGCPQELFDWLYAACITANPAWFQQVTAIRLFEDSRALHAGMHYFSAVSGFSQIPDASASKVVREACTVAMLEHSERTFVYWEPFVVNHNGIREHMTQDSCGQIVDFQQRMILKVAEQTRRFVRGLRRAQYVLEKVFAPVVRYRQRIAEARIIEEARQREQNFVRSKGRRIRVSRKYELTLEEALASLRRPLDDEMFRKLVARYDPIITFEVPEFAGEFNGSIPHALVAHWD